MVNRQFADEVATQAAELQFKRNGAGSWQTLQTIPITDPHGYFDVRQSFPASGSARLAWTYPGGSTVYSRTANVTVG